MLSRRIELTELPTAAMSGKVRPKPSSGPRAENDDGDSEFLTIEPTARPFQAFWLDPVLLPPLPAAATARTSAL